MSKNNIKELIRKVENYIIKNFKKNNPGHNGPYRDNETFIRSNAHMICFLSNIDPDFKYIEEVRFLVKQIFESQHKLDNYFFRNRSKKGKDEVNGVIGIAWIIEAVSISAIKYDFNDSKDFLLNIEEKIPFDNERCLWLAPSSSNSKKWKIDNNFNHQLWLAYALILKSKALKQDLSKNILLFFKKINKNLETRRSGLIVHSVRNNNKIKSILKDIRDTTICIYKNKSKSYKENGYHLFNLFAFARIKQEGFFYLFENSKEFKKALNYCNSQRLYSSLNKNNEKRDFYELSPPSMLEFNRYGIPYNVSGLEYLLIKDIFKLIDNEGGNKLIENQLSSYDLDNLENSHTEDFVNFILRTYEITFLN